MLLGYRWFIEIQFKYTPIRLAIIGLGRIGKIHLENLRNKIPGVEVVAAMALSEESSVFAQRFHIPLVTSDAHEIFDQPDIDAVIICSPTNTHADYVMQAAAAGKGIFCEKPLDLSVDKVRQTLNVVRKAKVPLMLGFNQRFDDNFSKAKNEVLSGNIGKVHTLHIISRDPAPPPLGYIKNSGGLFLDMMIHDFDMARFIMDTEVVEVFAKGYNLGDPQIGQAGDIDTGIVLLTF